MKKDKSNFKNQVSKLLVGTLIVGQLITIPITNINAVPDTTPQYRKEGYVDQAIKNVNMIVDNRGVEFNDSTGYPFITKEGRVIVPLRHFANAIGAKIIYDKEFPLMFRIKLNDRETTIWAYNNFSLVNNITYTSPIYPYVSGGKIYCDIEPLVNGLNLLTIVDNSTIDITTENQFFNDPLVNSALSPYDDIRFVVQKHNDNGMSRRQEATWNFVRMAKDTRNKRIYKNYGYTSAGVDPDWKLMGPANGWRIVSGVYPYSLKDKNGVDRVIIGTTGVNYSEKTEKIIMDRMKLNNYPQPKVAEYLRAVGQKNSLEVAYNHLNDINPAGDTYTYVNIDDYVEPDHGGGGISIRIEDKNKSKSTPEVKMYGTKTVDINDYYASDNKLNDELKDMLKNKRPKDGWDPYRGSIGSKKFRRVYTIIQPLNGDQEKFSAEEFLSRYSIFSGLMFPGAEFGVSTFSYYKESDKRWYSCCTIAVSNIGGLIESDKDKQFGTYKKDEDFKGGKKWWERKGGTTGGNRTGGTTGGSNTTGGTADPSNASKGL